MPQYIANNPDGVSNGTPTVEEGHFALTTDSGELIKIVRVKVSSGDAANTNAIRIRFLRCSTIGTGTGILSGTIVKKDPLAPASITVANEKGGITTTWVIGTIIDVIDDISFVGRGNLEWEAISDDDAIIIKDGEIFIVGLTYSSGTSVRTPVTVEWKEG